MKTDNPFVSQNYPVRCKIIRLNELDIFYREAGPENAPTLLLLHGFPTSSNMFRNLTAPCHIIPCGCSRLSRLRPKQYAESPGFRLHFRKPEQCCRTLGRETWTD